MGSDIEILNDEYQMITLEVNTRSVEIDFEDKTSETYARAVFNMGKTGHLEALQNFVNHLQHQLEIHKKEANEPTNK